ncbi:MAG: 30S ribosomal protein S12 methylthiotransferase RimO [Flavobacteriaceae bacterium]|tara:strand:+ start:813 stop:2114 length:1302 start_codon:yes stop_codon:yes gene_type:complete
MRTKSSIKNIINVITLGCSKNIYDSEILMGQLKANKKNVVHQKKGNIVVINTCGFINNAKEESINTILENTKLKELGKVDKVYVTGCLSERYKEDLISEIPEVDQYFGTSELPSLLKVLGADYKHELLGERIKTTPFNYSYLKISEGCDRPCSFCAIPLMRGKHLSTPIEDLVLQATKLAEKGIKELILIAQDLTYYGLDLYKKRNLVGLLKELVKIQGIEWIRLHYAFPSGFPIEVLNLMKNEPKICNYLDIPLQHVSDKILKSMKRGINFKKTTELVNEFRKIVPDISIRTTFIVGYPGETSKDFKLLLNWIKKMKFERLGCFKYSHEENTSAYDLEDDVSDKIKNKRLSEIMEAQRLISFNFNQKLIGRKLKCIIDRKEGKYFVGRTEMDSPDVDNEVLVDASRFYLKQGEFHELLITKVSDYDLFAIPC